MIILLLFLIAPLLALILPLLPLILFACFVAGVAMALLAGIVMLAFLLLSWAANHLGELIAIVSVVGTVAAAMALSRYISRKTALAPREAMLLLFFAVMTIFMGWLIGSGYAESAEYPVPSWSLLPFAAIWTLVGAIVRFRIKKKSHTSAGEA